MSDTNLIYILLGVLYIWLMSLTVWFIYGYIRVGKEICEIYVHLNEHLDLMLRSIKADNELNKLRAGLDNPSKIE